MTTKGWLVACALALAACKGDDKTATGAGSAAAPAAASEAPAATVAQTGATRDVDPADVERAQGACDAYTKALESCIKKLAPESRGAFQTTLDKHKEALAAANDAQTTQMEDGCRMGLATLEQNPACR